MVEIVHGALVILGLAFFGYGLIRLLPYKVIGIWERLLLGLMILLGVTPLFIFYGMLAGGRLGLFSPWILTTGGALGFAYWVKDLRQGRRPEELPLKTPGLPLQWRYEIGIIGLMILLLIEKLSFVAIQGFCLPTYFWDAIETWSYKAKVLYFTGYLDLNPQSETFLGGWKPHYPLGTSLFRAWMSTLLETWSEKAVALHSMVTYLLLFALIWIRLSKRIGWRYGFLFAYLAVSLPIIVHHAYAGYADLMLSLFFTGCLIYGYEYLLTRELMSGVVSALFLASSLFTKNEGLALIFPVLVITVALAIWQRQLSLRSASVYLIFPLFFILPWMVLKAHFGLSYNTSDTYSVFEIHLDGLAFLYYIVFRQGSFNLFGIFFVLSTLYYFRVWYSTELKFLALPIFLSIGGALGIFLFTKNYEFLENQMTINRTLMLSMPSYIYLVGLSMERCMMKHHNPTQKIE